MDWSWLQKFSGGLDQKIASAQFNLIQLQVGREAFMDKLKGSLG